MNNFSENSDFFLKTLFFLVILFAVALRVYGIWVWDLSYADEYHTYFDSLNQTSHRGVFSAYYYITRVSLITFGTDSVLALRLPSVAIALVTLPIFYKLVKDVFGKNVAVFSLSILAFSVWHVEMSQYARYYSTVFLLAAVHQLAFLKFLQTYKVNNLFISLIFGVLAFLVHAAAIFVFIPAFIYCLIFLKNHSRLGSRLSRKILISILIAFLIVIVISLPHLFEILSFWTNKSRQNPYANSWALIPLLALNQYSLPLFIASYLGVFGLKRQNKSPEFIYILIVLITALLLIMAFGVIMNFSVQYVFCFAPLFFVSAAILCNQMYQAFNSSSLFLSLSVLLILIVSQMPGLVSYFQERLSISHDETFAIIIEKAKPNATLITNMGVGLLEISDLKVVRSKKPPRNNRFNWNKYLDRYKPSEAEVWFAWKVSRIGLAPKLKKWLMENTELVYEKKANRIDRRERSVTVWRLTST